MPDTLGTRKLQSDVLGVKKPNVLDKNQGGLNMPKETPFTPQGQEKITTGLGAVAPVTSPRIQDLEGQLAELDTLPNIPEEDAGFSFIPQAQAAGGVQFTEADIATFDALLEEGFTPEEAKQALTEIKQEEIPEEKGFIGRIGEKLGERGERVVEDVKATHKQEIDPFSFALQTVGEGFGAAGDIIGETAITGLKQLGKGLGAVTPDFIEDPIKEKIGEAGTAILQSDTGQAGLKALGEGFEAWQGFEAEHPEAAGNIKALGNIAIFAPIGKLGSTVTKKIGKEVGKAGIGLEKAATKQATTKALKTTDDFVKELVSPPVSRKQLTEDILRGKIKEGGVITGRKRTLTEFEGAIVDEVSRTPGVSAKKTLLENNNALLRQIGKLDDKLTKEIVKHDVLIPKKEIKSRINAVKETLKENPLLVGDAERTAIKIINKFEDLVDKNPGKASGLLKSRKQLDSWIKAQKPNAFVGDKENALTIAVKEIRTAANNLADEKAVNVSVKGLLKRQSNLFRALENTAPKAAKEAPTKIGRLVQMAQKATGIKSELATTIGLVGGGAAATAAATMVPGLVIGGAGLLGTIKAGKLLLSPTAKKALGKAFIITSKALRKTPGNPDLQAIKTGLKDFLESNR